MTDAVEEMRSDGNTVRGFVFEDIRYDIGTFESLVEADEKAQGDDFGGGG